MNRLSSRDAWTAYAYDPDIVVSVPHRPRLIPELIAFPCDAESLLVVGAGPRKLLSGPVCKVLLSDLWPRLDGSADLGKLRAEVTGAGNVDEVLALLQRSDLIENGGEPPVAGLPAEVDSFLGRNVAIGGRFDSREQAAARLSKAMVIVLAPDADVGRLVERLRMSGLRAVFSACDPRVSSVEPSHYLVVGDDAGLAERVTRIPKDSRATVLLARVSGASAAIGPLVVPSRSACLACSVRAIADKGRVGEALDRAFCLELVVQHLFGAVTHTIPSQLYGVSITHAEADGQWVQGKVSVCRTPGCADCGLSGFSSLADGSDEAKVWRSLNSTMLPPWELLSRRTHEGHYSAANAALTKKADEAFDGEAFALAMSVEALAGTDARVLDALAKTGLALQMAYGYVSREVDGARRTKKVAPTGGGLRSPEAYVYLRAVAGIADGIYRYTPRGHQLQCVDSEVDVLALESALGKKLPEQCAVIIGIASAKKLWPKYRAMSNRLSFLDAGVAQAYVHDSCWALGVETHEFTDWRSEALLRLVQLPTCRRYFDIGSVTLLRFAGPADKANGLEAAGSEAHVGLGRSLGTITRYGSDNPQRWLPVTSNAFTAYVETAVGRAAVRVFSPDPIERDACGRLVRSFHARDSALRSSGAEPGHLRLMLVNNLASPGFPRGMYAAHEDGDLVLQQPITASAEIIECFNQRSIGSAPLILVAAANINALLSEQGAAGPMTGITRAAGLLAHAWLAARVMGMEGCLAGGFIESELRARMGLDGYGCFPLFALALGARA